MMKTLEAPWHLRVVLRWSWRGERRIATKLHGFAMTEQGSALDMFRAAEACDDPRARRLFLRHAQDETRHARRFRDLAARIDPGASARPHERRHALPQDLHARLGPERFLAFVHLAEASAERQFKALARAFAERAGHDRDGTAAELARLFTEVAREERFHVAYSRHLLGLRFPEAERARCMRRALRRERRRLLWTSWRRAGRGIGGRVTTLLMALVFVGVLPLFALVMRLSGQHRMPAGWHRAPAATAAGDARRLS